MSRRRPTRSGSWSATSRPTGSRASCAPSGPSSASVRTPTATAGGSPSPGPPHPRCTPRAGPPPPDEEWVVVGYLAPDGQPRELRAEWTIVGIGADADGHGGGLPEHGAAAPAIDPEGEAIAATALGLDLEGDTIRRVHELLYAP